MAKEWYILHIFSGYEKKIERAIRQLIDNNSIPPGVVSEIKIPEEELTEVKDGKKKVVRRKFLPGYILIEMDLPATNWKGVCAPIRRIHGVTGFLGVVGDARPQAISAEEAKSVLQKSGEIKGEKPRAAQIFAEGQQVKIIEGPFASFTGSVEEIMSERNKLRVMVPIFGRTTPVEVDMLQVELV
ncbi:MAG: transcription termination/antitermination protein NusG [Treponema sp.]|uniref:transcription termination/antitermination protein NusG n=1 Tax=Treponema sp. TaxID=166 RepID=UPI003FA2F28B